MDKIRKLSIPKNARIIVISDIHGELELFKALLEKVQFGKDDFLIINGDLTEKGQNSMGVLNYIIDLSATNPRVHVTEGNCDTIVEDLLQENPKLINYLCARPHTLLNEWLESLGFEINEGTSVQEIKKILTSHFSNEINWLNDLPTAIETEDYIFVHAGLENLEDWKDTKRDTAIAIPSFLEKSHRAGKYVIVGHWPVVNYCTDIPSHNPIIHDEKKIIAMDGGNVIKETGQLNALIIDPSHFSYTYVDGFPTIQAAGDFCAAPLMIGSISYPNYEIEPVEKGDHFTLCSQLKTNRDLYVKNEYIHKHESGYFTVKSDVSCAQLTVRKGETFSILDDTCTGYYLIKKDGVIGWVPHLVVGE